MNETYTPDNKEYSPDGSEKANTDVRRFNPSDEPEPEKDTASVSTDEVVSADEIESSSNQERALLENKEKLDEQMEHALREMTTIESPSLNKLKYILDLPIDFMRRHSLIYLVWYIFTRTFLETGDYDMVWLLCSPMFISMFGGFAIETYVNKLNKCAVSKDIIEQLVDKGFIIHSYDRTGSIPYYMITHSHLIHDVSGFCSGDYINLSYRDYAVACCNIVFTQPRTPVLDWKTPLDQESETEVFLDQYKEDDIQAAKDFQIGDGTDVVFFGSVFLFTPGPDIEGSVSLEAVDPIEYLCKLRNMEETETLERPEREQDRIRLFYSNHSVHGENHGNKSETGRVFTRRVMDMVMRLELHMRAPVEVYADKNMVCLIIQEKAIDNEIRPLRRLGHIAEAADEVRLERMEAIRKILEIATGPEGAEYNELFCKCTDRRKSVYSPLLHRFSKGETPDDNEIKTYVDALIEWPEEQNRFFVNHSRNFHEICAQMNPLCRQFLTGLFSYEDQTQLTTWINSEAGIKMINSLTKVMADRFREVWSAPAKYSVEKIIRTKELKNNDLVTIEIKVVPRVRRWYYTEETNRRMISLCGSLRNDFHKLFVDQVQREFIDIFKKQLCYINGLSYDEEHKYKITMKALDNGYFGFPFEEFNNFNRWYLDLLESNMRVNGEEFSL